LTGCPFNALFNNVTLNNSCLQTCKHCPLF
jgi:hypothetical protein